MLETILAFIWKSFKLCLNRFKIISEHLKTILIFQFISTFEKKKNRNIKNSPLWNCHSKLASRSFWKCFKLVWNRFQIMLKHFKIILKTVSNRFKFWEMKNTWTFLYGAVAQDRLSVHFKVVQIIPKSVSNHFKSLQNHVEINSQPFQVLRNQ